MISNTMENVASLRPYFSGSLLVWQSCLMVLSFVRILPSGGLHLQSVFFTSFYSFTSCTRLLVMQEPCLSCLMRSSGNLYLRRIMVATVPCMIWSCQRIHFTTWRTSLISLLCRICLDTGARLWYFVTGGLQQVDNYFSLFHEAYIIVVKKSYLDLTIFIYGGVVVNFQIPEL